MAGVDVARRALDPRLPLRPGFVTYAPRLPPGGARDAFCALASLMPGTLPADTNEDGTLLVHCLDRTAGGGTLGSGVCGVLLRVP
jgi:multicomponent Na+:H+ antiporter subunit E